MTASLTLSTDWGIDPVSDDEIKKIALHEVLEMLLALLIILGKSRYPDQDDFTKESHAIINRLMPRLR